MSALALVPMIGNGVSFGTVGIRGVSTPSRFDAIPATSFAAWPWTAGSPPTSITAIVPPGSWTTGLSSDPIAPPSAANT